MKLRREPVSTYGKGGRGATVGAIKAGSRIVACSVVLCGTPLEGYSVGSNRAVSLSVFGPHSPSSTSTPLRTHASNPGFSMRTV